jgi:hypothetical protein
MVIHNSVGSWGIEFNMVEDISGVKLLRGGTQAEAHCHPAVSRNDEIDCGGNGMI